MEPIKDRAWRPAQFTLFALVLLFCLLPLVAAFTGWTLDFDLSALSLPFWTLIIKSTAYSLLQAALSASFSIIFGIFVGSGLCFLNRNRFSAFISKLCSSLGYFCFVLPGVSVALLVLNFSRGPVPLPEKGLFAIVLAHFVLNALFLSSQIEQRIKAWFFGAGSELSMAAQTLGASSFSAKLLVMKPVLLQELRTWWPLVFLWSFSAFATVVILGGAPKFSTPEVLLYYFLQNDFTSARIFVLCLVQVLIAAVLLRLVTRASRRHASELLTGTVETEYVSKQLDTRSKVHKFLALTCAICFSAVLVYNIADALIVLRTASLPSEELLWGMLHSLGLATSATLWSLILTALLFLCSREGRHLMFLSGAFASSTLIAAAYLGLGLDQNLSFVPSFVQIALCGLLISFGFMPLLALWVDQRVQSFSSDLSAAASTLGANPFTRLRHVTIPLNSDLFFRVGRLSFLGAIGELSLSTLLVRDLDFAAGLSRQMALRYDFTATKWLLLFIVLTTLLISLTSKKNTRKYGKTQI